MATKIASLFVGLTADDRGYNEKLRKSQARTKAWGKVVDRTTKAAGDSFKRVGVGAGVATAALTALYTSNAASIDQLAKNASALGLTTDSLFEFGLAAQFGGVEITTATTAIAKMNRNLGEALEGTGPAFDALRLLGLSASELAQLRPEQAYERIAIGLEEIQAPAQKAQIAMDLFGRSGVALLNVTSDVLKQAREDIEAMGGAITSIEAKQIEIANDSVTRLGTAADLVGQKITVKLAGSVSAVADQLFESSKQGVQLQGTIDQLIVSSIRGLSTFAGSLQQVLSFIDDRSEIAEFGALGFLLFGRKGALIGALVGSLSGTTLSTFNAIKGQLGLIDGEREQLEARLQNLQQQLRNREENEGFLGATVGGFVSDVFYDDVDEVESEIAKITARLEELGSTAGDSGGFISGVATSMGAIAEGLAIAADNYGTVVTSISDLEIPSPEGPPSIAGIGDQVKTEAELAKEAAAELAKTLESLTEANTFSYIYTDRIEAAKEAVEAQKAANDEDLRISQLYFNQKTAQVKAFQDTWTTFQQAGSGDRLKILFSETSGALSSLAQYSKGFFKINQASGLANAAVNVAQGITEALKLPFPASLAAAAAVAVRGVAQIKTITSARFGSASVASTGGTSAPVTDVSSVGSTNSEVESGNSQSNQEAVQTTNYYIVSADELIDPEVFEERTAQAIASQTQSRKLVYNSSRDQYETNSELAVA